MTDTDQKVNKFVDFWPGFEEEDHMIRRVFAHAPRRLTVLGPFRQGNRSPRRFERESKLRRLLRGNKKADFFVTGENVPPQFARAHKQIGFWRSFPNRADVLRFPYWKWYLDWPEIDDLPPCPRFGERMSIDRLMQPIEESYNAQQLARRSEGAILLSHHLVSPRKRLYQLTNDTIGCLGFGKAFGKEDRSAPKISMFQNFRFSLCPENAIGDGYITEKIPEAFYAGCVPIAWCRPEDLAADFNPLAVLNLYGLNDYECLEVLERLRTDHGFYQSFLKEPLLLEKPSLAPLLSFIEAT